MSDPTTGRIAKGAGWIYSYRWIERLLGFASIAILARLLVEEDFGLVAIAASVVAVVEGLSEFDVKNALIQSAADDDDRDLFDSAWTMAALRGLLAAVVMVAASAVVTDADLAAVLVVLAAMPVLDGVANPQFVRFERELVYSPLAIQTLVATVVSLGVTVGVAVVERTHWALVAGMIAGSATRTLLSYTLRPYGPRPTLRRWREIFAFSGWMTAANVVATLAMRTDRLIVGGLLGTADAGSYYMANRVGVLPTSELISPLQRILFPSFSRIADDTERLRRAVRESVNVLGSLSLPAALGFALTANDFVPIVLGARWTPIVPLLVALVPILGLRATLSTARSCVMALGRTQLMFRVSLLYALVHFPAFLTGTALFGLTGAIWGIVAAGVFYAYLNAWLLRATLGLTLLEILVQLRRPAAAAAAMVGVVLAAQGIWPALDLFSAAGCGWALVIKVTVGGATYVGTLVALWRLEGRPPGLERRVAELLTRGRSRG